MSRLRTFVELNDKDLPIRIFRSTAAAMQFRGGVVSEWPRVDAVRAIRQQVFERADGQCERCGGTITWSSSEMHERVPKGNGGEVSLSNCWMLCNGCHQSRPDSEHGDRRWGGRKNA